MTLLRLHHCSLNLNPHAQRFIQSLQGECLDRFNVMETGHLDHLVGESLVHYNTERRHWGEGAEYRVVYARKWVAISPLTEITSYFSLVLS